MKTFKIFGLIGITLLSFAGCSPEDDIQTPYLKPVIFTEDFAKGAVDNVLLTTPNWENIAEVGTAKWKTQVYSGNAYAEFTSYQSGELSNVGWLISPKINMDLYEGEVLQFQASQSYVTSSTNSLEVLISTDYDGTNLTTANWTPVTGANLPGTSATYFEFMKSIVDLSAYTGDINIAFKVKGSGTNTALDGSYQIDDVKIYTNN